MPASLPPSQSTTRAAPAGLSIRPVPRDRGLAWLAAGWSCFRRRWQPLAVLSIGMLIVLWLLSRHGGILFPVLATIYLGTVAAYCRMDRQGEAFLAGSGAWRKGALWALALVVVLLSLAQAGLVAAIAAGAMATGAYSPAHFGKGLFYAFAAAQLLVMLVFSTFWLAPALVVERGVGALQALRLSVMGSLRNPLPFLTVVALGGLMTVLAMLPLGLGLVVAMPGLACAAAAAGGEIVA